MCDNYFIKCCICSTTHESANITDSSCFTKFFMQVMSLKDFKGQLWLCKWCKGAIQKSIDIVTIAVEAEKEQNQTVTNTRLSALEYYHHPPIDIPPANEAQATDDTGDSVTILELTNEVDTRNENNKENEVVPQNENESDDDEDVTEMEMRDRKKLYNFDNMKFDIIYLKMREQLKEVEENRAKYKNYEYQCTHCGLGFLKSDLFVEHKIRHSEFTGKFACQVCGVRFRSQEVLCQHTLQHRRRFKCQICASEFKRWSRCIAHRCTCGAVLNHIACNVCSKIFTDEHKLKVHMKIHSRDNYCCDHCKKNFSSKQHLIVHIRTHTNNRPFTCVPCGRSFTTGSNLRAHRTVHSKLSPHYCVECHAYYKTAKSLSRHLNESARHADKNVDTFPCPECPKQFTTEKAMKYHIISQHGEEYRCSYCKKKFATKSNLNKHVKTYHSHRVDFNKNTEKNKKKKTKSTKSRI